MRVILAPAAAILALLAGCGPETGTGSGSIPMATSISQSDRQQGAQAKPELLQEFGGAYAGPQASYVASVGRKIAVQSSLSSAASDFDVTLLNSSVNNAFATPGGYIYITRQLMALCNDEAEMAGVLGHEVGHVAALHGQRRQQAATRNAVGGALLQILTGAILGNSGLGGLLQQGIGTGTQLLTLSFSRAQEYEADDLGIRYLSKAGYDPAALSSMLASLAADSALEARTAGKANAVPEWASTHPDPASRVTRALTKAREVGATSTLRNRDVFLNALNGVTYGDDPAQGVINGTRFVHPALRLSFTSPTGYAMVNGTQAVTITGSGGQAQFTGGSYSGNLDAYVASAFQAIAGSGSAPSVTPTRTSVNGVRAAYATVRANSQSGQVDVTVFAYETGPSQAFHFVMLTPAGQGLGPFGGMVQSFQRINAQEAAAVQARRISVVTVKAGDTAQSLSSRMAYDDYKLQRFLVLNGLKENAALTPGGKVKIVTYGS